MPKRIDATAFNCGERYHGNGCCYESSAKPGQKFYRKMELLKRFSGNKAQRRWYASGHLNMTGNEFILAENLIREGSK